MRASGIRNLILLVLPSLFLTGSLASAQSQAQRPAPKQLAVDTNYGKVYEKWLDEDVHWIISAQERSDFLNLATDELRDKFVEAFWAHRNPTQGAPENKYKEKHYQRLAYANQYFAAGVPGWKTDRGRIYIVYGPPDQIERHPNGAVLGALPRYSYEVWHYQNMKGADRDISVEFVDTCQCGDSRMTVDPTEKHPPAEKE